MNESDKSIESKSGGKITREQYVIAEAAALAKELDDEPDDEMDALPSVWDRAPRPVTREDEIRARELGELDDGEEDD